MYILGAYIVYFRFKGHVYFTRKSGLVYGRKFNTRSFPFMCDHILFCSICVLRCVHYKIIDFFLALFFNRGNIRLWSATNLVLSQHLFILWGYSIYIVGRIDFNLNKPDYRQCTTNPFTKGMF